MTQPNILWICTDQQRFDTLGCYGNPLVHSPNIDRLAENGVLFENCFSQSPVCTPSRSAFLTGRYPRTARGRQNGANIPEDEVLVTRLLADDGYLCGLSGKLHLSVCHPTVVHGVERRINDGYAEFHWSHHPTPNWTTSEYVQWLAENGVEYSTPSFEGSKVVEAGMPTEYHQTTWCADKAITFIKSNAGKNEPWLFSVNIFDPHHPFDAPVEYLQPYLEHLDEIPLPNYTPGELDDKPKYQQIDHRGAYNNPGYYPFDQMSDHDKRLVIASYWAMCDLVDAQVGRMMQALEDSGQLENTIVIFMSDHGEMLGDHGFYLKGPFFYEPAIHVPLIISWKNHITPGRRASALVELIDIAPTLLDAAGLPAYGGMQATSLWSMLLGDAPLDHLHDDLYCEYYNAWIHKDAHATMVRTDRYKLVAYHGQHMGELYDLQADPTETDNLWSDPNYTAIKLDLYERLTDRMAWTVDPLPVRHALW